MTPANLDFSAIEVADRLPVAFRPEDAEKFPPDMAGATIIRIGAVSDCRLVEGGGLVIDYRPQGSTIDKRVVFAFTELGMWLEFEQVLRLASSPQV